MNSPTRNLPTKNPRLLRSMLRENAVFSLVTGLVFAVAASRIDEWVGLPAWLLISGGVGLIGYAVFAWVGAANDSLIEATGRIAVAGDVSWVVGAVAVVGFTSWLTPNGEVALLLVSIPVLAFALGQAKGLDQMRPPRSSRRAQQKRDTAGSAAHHMQVIPQARPPHRQG